MKNIEEETGWNYWLSNNHGYSSVIEEDVTSSKQRSFRLLMNESTIKTNTIWVEGIDKDLWYEIH